MSKTPKKIMSPEDLVLYISNKLEPEKSDKMRLNKLAFLVEFSFLLKYGRSLSNANYAAIDHGPVIDGYDKLFLKMQENSLIKIDGFKIRPLKSRVVSLTDEEKSFVDSVMEKYSKLSNSELRSITHDTDSYKITTDNEKIMGKKIDKDLAKLETFLDENISDAEEGFTILEKDLPAIDRNKLVKYAG